MSDNRENRGKGRVLQKAVKRQFYKKGGHLYKCPPVYLVTLNFNRQAAA